MLMPKRVKYRKQQRGKMNGKAKGGTIVHFEWGIKALEPLDYCSADRVLQNSDHKNIEEEW